MANLTVSVDEAILKKARLRASSDGVSITQVLRKFLESYVGGNAQQVAAVNDLLNLSRRMRSRNDGTKRWSREELHQRL